MQLNVAIPHTNCIGDIPDQVRGDRSDFETFGVVSNNFWSILSSKAAVLDESKRRILMSDAHSERNGAVTNITKSEKPIEFIILYHLYRV